jgi:hypothetical protein
MDTHFYGGPGNVVIDSCENCCLTWLDGGELKRIATAPEEQFATTETLLTSPTMDSSLITIDPSLSGDMATTLAVDVAGSILLDGIDSLFRG